MCNFGQSFSGITDMQILPSVTSLTFIKTPEAAVILISTAVIPFLKQLVFHSCSKYLNSWAK